MNRTIRGVLALAFAAATTAALMTPSTATTDPDRIPGPSIGGGQRPAHRIERQRSLLHQLGEARDVDQPEQVDAPG